MKKWLAVLVLWPIAFACGGDDTHATPSPDGGGDAGTDGGTDPAFGPTDNATLGSTLFVLFYPSTTHVTISGQGQCTSWGSYHSDTTVAGKSVSYAVVPRCSTMASDLVFNTMFE